MFEKKKYKSSIKTCKFLKKKFQKNFTIDFLKFRYLGNFCFNFNLRKKLALN